jgi:ADP-ribose pyrophosphatase YjhB (NUDIX family)
MPPGGHIDENETPEDAAKRECKEETDLDVEIVGDQQPNLFAKNPHEGRMLIKPIAMLMENIPESKERNEPAHQHMDFLFIARPTNEDKAQEMSPTESDGMRWFTKEDIEKLDEQTEIFSNVKTYIVQALNS